MAKKKSRSNNPEGRPKEYREKRRAVSLSLPESLVRRLDELSEEVGSSRQRLIVEWLMIAQLLENDQYLWSGPAGTFFEQFPTRQPRDPNHTRKPMTYRSFAQWFEKLPEEERDDPVRGIMFLCFRDQVQEEKMMEHWKQRGREILAAQEAKKK